MRVLIVGPYVGEIGWELMSWQARVRWVFACGGFDRLVVLGASGRSAWYADMPLDYRTVDLSHLPGSAYEDRRVAGEAKEPLSVAEILEALAPLVESVAHEYQADGCSVETLWPAYAGKLWPADDLHQRFIRFSRPTREATGNPWVVLVKRIRQFKSDENWSQEYWDDLGGLLADCGIRTTTYPCDADAAIEALSGCDLAIGHSTGGLHLASLCGCPHVVWSDDDSRLYTPWEMTQRQRYETMWNPLGTPVIYHADNPPPDPAKVATWVRQALERIGRRTGSGTSRVTFRSKWAVRNWMTRQLVRRESFRRWPWPVQRFVRYGLI